VVRGIASGGHPYVLDQLKKLPGLVFHAQKVADIVPVDGKGQFDKPEGFRPRFEQVAALLRGQGRRIGGAWTKDRRG
jgi:hypothetical protein